MSKQKAVAWQRWNWTCPICEQENSTAVRPLLNGSTYVCTRCRNDVQVAPVLEAANGID